MLFCLVTCIQCHKQMSKVPAWVQAATMCWEHPGALLQGLYQLLSPKVRGQKKRWSPVSWQAMLAQYSNSQLLGVKLVPKQSQCSLCGQPQRNLVLGLSLLGEDCPAPTEAVEISILTKLLISYLKKQNSSNGFHSPPIQTRILKEICNLSLKTLVSITPIFIPVFPHQGSFP